MKLYQRSVKLLLGLLVLAAAAVCLCGCRKESVKMSEELSVAYEGFSSVGRARLQLISEEEFVEKYAELFKLTKPLKRYFKNEGKAELEAFAPGVKANNLSSGELAFLFYRSALSEVFRASALSEDSRLFNGQELSFRWNDETLDSLGSYIKLFGVPISWDEGRFTVSGLTEVPTFDPFSGVAVVFDSYSPCGTASYNVLSPHIEGESYVLSQESGLQNGDTVTLSYILPFDDEECAGRYGMLPAAWEKEFTVSGLAEFLLTEEQLSQEILTKLDSTARTLYKSWHWTNASTEEELKLLGYYLIVPADTASAAAANYLVPVYSVNYTAHITNVTGWREEFLPGILYWDCVLKNVSLKPDGSLNYESMTTVSHTYRVKTEIISKENERTGSKEYYSFSAYAYADLASLKKGEVNGLLSEGFSLIEKVSEP